MGNCGTVLFDIGPNILAAILALVAALAGYAGGRYHQVKINGANGGK
jgi:hypothetical protein